MSRANTMNKEQLKLFYKSVDKNKEERNKIYADTSKSPYSRAFRKNQSRIFDHELSAQLSIDDLSNYDPH